MPACCHLFPLLAWVLSHCQLYVFSFCQLNCCLSFNIIQSGLSFTFSPVFLSASLKVSVWCPISLSLSSCQFSFTYLSTWLFVTVTSAASVNFSLTLPLPVCLDLVYLLASCFSLVSLGPANFSLPPPPPSAKYSPMVYTLSPFNLVWLSAAAWVSL